MRVTVAGREGVEHFEKPAPVAVRAGHLLAVNLAASRRVVALRVERLPVGADAGIAKAAVLRVSFGHILRQT